MRKNEQFAGSCCGTCLHFRQHYIKWGKGFMAQDWGHCKYPRLKDRDVEAVCKHWAARAEP